MMLENEEEMGASSSSEGEESEKTQKRLTLSEMTEGSVDQLKLLETSKQIYYAL